MNLASHLLLLLDNPTLSRVEQAHLRCELAREMEEAGDYEAARHALGELWQRIGERPQTDFLDERTAAETLLRAGTLSGWIGSANQIEGAQEIAKDLISESAAIFRALGETERAAEADIDLAICYWREGAFDEARITLRDALRRLGEKDIEQRARALLNSGVVERSAKRFNDALRILTEAAPVFEASRSDAIKGKFHHQLATVLRSLGDAEQRRDYIDRALVEYAAASFHFEQAGHVRFGAAVENNLGFLFLNLGKYAEAQAHLDRARRLFVSLKDSVHAAQVDETRARVFLAQGGNSKAEEIARGAVRTLERGDEHSLLAEALTTHGTALARLNRFEQARAALERAIEVAHQAGDAVSAGVAALTMIEELGERLKVCELIENYERADDLLAGSQQPAIPLRLRAVARRILAAQREPSDQPAPSRFIYVSEEIAGLLQCAHRIALTSYVVLITGETGTGKELLARLVHEWSGRSGSFVAVNCAALTETLLDARLFGHQRSGRTDADQDSSPGAVREASGGTLFLDEISELSMVNQGKILRLIEQGEIHPVGASKPERVDVRIIAATSRDLQDGVGGGLFRASLFYRLATFHLEIPPLRERPEDIIALAEQFIEESLKQYGQRVHWTPEAIAAMRGLRLEGNVRELRALIERTMLEASEGAIIGPEAVETVALRHGSEASFANPWNKFSLKEEVRRIERRFIELALKAAQGRVSQAARLLGFKHHQSLTSLIESKHQPLHAERAPVKARKRSITRGGAHRH
ncbi:MAG TPA: sigma 54-interacting transcriptional regulator [Pyrinomonadaceae bacterium]|jgi:transcriptional regulator with PAS, ATPase and Fis domain|nr:sigma 54-interacting transcriptional regulator [Pyrinomonadaceae bacterium]